MLYQRYPTQGFSDEIFNRHIINSSLLVADFENQTCTIKMYSEMIIQPTYFERLRLIFITVVGRTTKQCFFRNSRFSTTRCD